MASKFIVLKTLQGIRLQANPEFFALCQADNFAKTLLYVDVPEYYTWNNKSWQRRKQETDVAGYPGVKHTQALGRIYNISPRQEECFYFHLLLHNIKGPQLFAYLKTVNGDLCSLFHEACLKLGLLEDDNQYHLDMEEAIVSNSPASIRTLFAVILAWCEPSNPLEIYGNHKEAMAEDFLHQQHVLHRDEHVEVNNDVFNFARKGSFLSMAYLCHKLWTMIGLQGNAVGREVMIEANNKPM